MAVTFSSTIRPSIEQIADLYRQASLNRPVNDLDRVKRFYDGSNIVLTAWDGELFIGILRGWTDGAYDGYVCDLAVLPSHQKQGIGRQLLDQVLALNPQVQFVLRASKIAANYYSHIGWQKIENGYFWPREAWT